MWEDPRKRSLECLPLREVIYHTNLISALRPARHGAQIRVSVAAEALEDLSDDSDSNAEE